MPAVAVETLERRQLLSATPAPAGSADDAPPAFVGGKLAYTASSGATVKVTVKGGGSPSVAFDGYVNGMGDPSTISIAGSTASTSLSVVVTPAKGSKVAHAAIGGFDINGPISTLSAPKVTLTGSSTFTGGIRSLTVAGTNSTAGEMKIGGATAARLTLGDVDGLSVDSAASLASVTATNWADGGTVSAPSIATFSVTGTDAASLTVTKAITTFKAKAVSVATITAATIGTVAVAGAMTGSTLEATTIKSISVGSLSESDVEAGGAITTVKAGAMSTVTITATTLGTVAVTGAVTDSQLLATTSIKSVSVGSLAGSDVFAGVASTVTSLPTSPADLANLKSSIGSFVTHESGGFSDGSAVAAATVTSATIAGAAATGAGGIAAETFGSVLIRQGKTPVKYGNKTKKTVPPTVPGTDFEISVIAAP
jgi:hypothetical protein